MKLSYYLLILTFVIIVVESVDYAPTDCPFGVLGVYGILYCDNSCRTSPSIQYKCNSTYYAWQYNDTLCAGQRNAIGQGTALMIPADFLDDSDQGESYWDPLRSQQSLLTDHSSLYFLRIPKVQSAGACSKANGLILYNSTHLNSGSPSYDTPFFENSTGYYIGGSSGVCSADYRIYKLTCNLKNAPTLPASGEKVNASLFLMLMLLLGLFILF